jgi:hypothetical protein
MRDCLDATQYKYIIGMYKSNKNDDNYMHLSDVGILEHVLEQNVIPSMITVIYNTVDEWHAASLTAEVRVGRVGGKRNGDDALLHTPPKKRKAPLTESEDWARLLKEQWRFFNECR